MTTEQLHDLIGTTRLIKVGPTMTVRVKVLGAKINFGRVDLMVSPEAGSGSLKVALESTEAVQEPVPV